MTGSFMQRESGENFSFFERWAQVRFADFDYPRLDRNEYTDTYPSIFYSRLAGTVPRQVTHARRLLIMVCTIPIIIHGIIIHGGPHVSC